jgi:peroxiredoxin
MKNSFSQNANRSNKFWWIAGGLAIGLIFGFLVRPPSNYTARPLAYGENDNSSLTVETEGESAGFTYAAPEFSLEDDHGDMISLDSFRGRPVLVNFWASWCPPCKEEMSTFEEYYQRYMDDGLVILAINTDDSMEVISRFREENNLSFYLLQDSEKGTIQKYAVIGLPSSFFIDRDGRIVNRHVGLLTDELLDIYFSEMGISP